jgi:hypothetical protein
MGESLSPSRLAILGLGLLGIVMPRSVYPHHIASPAEKCQDIMVKLSSRVAHDGMLVGVCLAEGYARQI